MKKFKVKTRPSEDTGMAIGGEIDEKFVNEKLRKLVEEAYGLFVYDLSGNLSVFSPYCVCEENVKKLIETPVRN